MDGEPIATLTGEVAGAQFPADPGAGVFSVTYEGTGGSQGPTELRRVIDGAVFPPGSDASAATWFAPDPMARVFAMTYETEPAECVRSWMAGSSGTGTANGRGEVRHGPDGPVVAVTYASSDVADVELFRPTDGSSSASFEPRKDRDCQERERTDHMQDAEGCGIWDAAGGPVEHGGRMHGVRAKSGRERDRLPDGDGRSRPAHQRRRDDRQPAEWHERRGLQPGYRFIEVCADGPRIAQVSSGGPTAAPSCASWMGPSPRSRARQATRALHFRQTASSCLRRHPDPMPSHQRQPCIRRRPERR